MPDATSDPLVCVLRLLETQGWKAVSNYLSDLFDERNNLLIENARLRDLLHAANTQLQWFVQDQEARSQAAGNGGKDGERQHDAGASVPGQEVAA